MATIAIEDERKRRNMKILVWSLAGAGIVAAALQQIDSYRSDKVHEVKQDALQATLNASLQKQEYARGQLDSIGLMIGKVGEKTTDPVLAQLAGAIARMAQGTRIPTAPSPRDAHIQVLYEGIELNGRTFSIRDNSKIINLADFKLRNTGTSATGPTSLRLYLSKEANTTTPYWVPTASDEAGFPAAFYSAGVGAYIIINPQEIWNWPSFMAQNKEDVSEPIRAKLKVFYGAEKPAEAHFVIARKM